MEQHKPLRGVKVVELSLMVAAASCGRMMADWGADVIKVENTKGGDNFRKWPLGIGAPADDDYDPLFDNLNANKRAISLDTRTPAGQEVMYKLLAGADVFLTNLRTEALKKSGLDYDTLHQKFPKLVMAQLDGYGEKGEEAGRPGYDNTAFWARGGFLYSQSVYGDSPDTYPVYMPMGFGDVTCAMGMMAATVSAVLSARQTGKGDRVSLSLYGTAIWLANILVSGAQYGFHLPKRRENSSPFGAPFKCSDGRWFMPQVVNFNRDAALFYKLLGAEDMIGDPRYATRANFNKVEICKPVMERFEKAFATKTAREWQQIFSEADLSCEILYGYDDILTDPQAIVNDFVYKMEYPNGKSSMLVRSCLRSQEMGLPEFRPGPMLGEHSVEILKELGYGEEQIRTMLDSGAVKQHP
ncbi:CoA transferase [Pseudoflavonifractor phocaeensis]|uniref:CaiB/BaiF CoA transferase family protein n=1 Tax=Pseudoflavonifractor phocaeensis TaxID=1870988 RepID=UPI00195A8875|nr:CaiB/BaiF CoA-transferase family protein [Pseudoflavonifractor phocaeensis]MBM6871378.1 CoA transferase [Pseudoflavonifractor phocaeensis]MBM6937906.1 CoA transferase [Pseudoflavonifractor phocaeensis]